LDHDRSDVLQVLLYLGRGWRASWTPTVALATVGTPTIAACLWLALRVLKFLNFNFEIQYLLLGLGYFLLVLLNNLWIILQGWLVRDITYHSLQSFFKFCFLAVELG
jgi:hypothetical protein